MAVVKEPKFLTRQVGRNEGAPDPAPASSSNFRRGWSWYTELFVGQEHKAARGEASTMYLDAPDAPAIMASVVPRVRLIFCLRHPVDRIYSHYWHERRYDDLPDFAELVATEHPRLGWYVDQSHYARHLARYQSLFDPEQILIVFSEDLATDKEQTFRRVCDHIGVKCARLSDASEGVRYNTAATTRWPRLHRLLAHHRKDWTRPLPHFAVNPARRAKAWILQRNMAPARYPPMPDELRAALIERFIEDIVYVEQLTGRELPSWRR